VTLVELKATGRFGSVWKAEMVGRQEEDYVAVKILPMREKTSWRLEQEVYSLPLMCDSKLILGYFGSRSDPENMQLWLISEYISRGSLYDYLKVFLVSLFEQFRES
jgi:serine/threonine protein kinase